MRPSHGSREQRERSLAHTSLPAIVVTPTVTLTAIQEVCREKVWTLLAFHVLTSHIHVVVQAADSPEWVMSTLKRFASRAPNNLGIDNQKDQRRWARHGSTRYIGTREQLSAAIRYTVSGQGDKLAVYETP